MLDKLTLPKKGDVLIFSLLLLSLVQGFTSTVIFGERINIIAYINIFIFIILFWKLLAGHKLLFIITTLLFILYYAILGYFNGANVKEVYMHLFTYIPFLNAIMMIQTGSYYSVKNVFVYFSAASAIGALTAVTVMFYFPDILIKVVAVEDFEAFMQWGRLPWIGSVMLLILLSQMFFLHIYTKSDKIVLLPSLLLVFIGGFFTFNRTLLFAVFLMSLIWLLKEIRNVRFKNIFLTVVGFMIVAYIFSSWGNINENFDNLLQGRVLDPLSGKLNLDSDISSRNILYEQYIENIKRSYLFGQGFGVPYSTIPEPRAWADITVVSFLIPFGLLGLGVFVVFIKKLYININLIQSKQIRYAMIIVLTLQLLISMNDDLWSHKNFPMYFVFIINSFLVTQKEIRNR